MTRHTTQQQKPPLDENARRNWSPDDAGWQDARLVVDHRDTHSEAWKPTRRVCRYAAEQAAREPQAVSVKQ